MNDGGGFGVAAGAVLAMGRAQSGRQAEGQQRNRAWEQLHQVPIGAVQVPITAGAGAYQMADLLSPKAGFMWGIRRITASGYTAGSVVVYKNGSVVGGVYTGGGEPIAPFAAAATLTIGRGEAILDQMDQLVIVCTGITLSAGFAGVQINGAADCFERWLLPEYMGIGG